MVNSPDSLPVHAHNVGQLVSSRCILTATNKKTAWSPATLGKQYFHKGPSCWSSERVACRRPAQRVAPLAEAPASDLYATDHQAARCSAADNKTTSPWSPLRAAYQQRFLIQPDEACSGHALFVQASTSSASSSAAQWGTPVSAPSSYHPISLRVLN